MLAAFVAGLMMRSRLRFIDAASNGVPSWNLTPSRSVNVNFRPSPSMTQVVARPGMMVALSSSATSVSTMLLMTSVPEAPDGFAGSMLSFESHWPQVSVPP